MAVSFIKYMPQHPGNCFTQQVHGRCAAVTSHAPLKGHCSDSILFYGHICSHGIGAMIAIHVTKAWRHNN